MTDKKETYYEKNKDKIKKKYMYNRIAEFKAILKEIKRKQQKYIRYNNVIRDKLNKREERLNKDIMNLAGKIDRNKTKLDTIDKKIDKINLNIEVDKSKFIIDYND